MNTRKNQLKSLFGKQPEEQSPPGSAPAAEGQSVPALDAPKRATSGAVKAMGLSLNSLSQEVEDARRLRDNLSRGDQVVELDPAFIERSPYLDRLSDGQTLDDSFEDLKQSIAEHSQQVPVLVRPHADAAKAEQGYYQIAYGHRRVAAARALGRTVRAVVRKLDDTQLVVAQGKENAEHRALSFIERAFFAKTLVDHGFERATAQAALAVHKSEMSRLLQVAEMIPVPVAQAIGPAPKAGRPRWLAMGELLANKRINHWAMETMKDQSFRDCSVSDMRFQMIFERLLSSRNDLLGGASASQAITDAQGATIGEFTSSARAARLTIPASAGRGFADYVAAQLPTLHAAFQAEQDNKPKADPAEA